MSEADPSKTSRKTSRGMFGNAPSMRSRMEAAGETGPNPARVAANIPGAAIGTAADRIAGGVAGAVGSVASNVVSPILNTVMLKQLPLLGVALGTISSIMKDIKDKALEKEQLRQQQQQTDRIGEIVTYTGETVENTDELEEILQTLADTVYEGVYEGVQDGIAKLIGDFMDDVGDGVQDALSDFVEEGGNIEDAIQSLQQKIGAIFGRGSGEDDPLLDSVQNIESMLASYFEAVYDDMSDNRFNDQEKALESRPGILSGLKEKAGSGLKEISEGLENIMKLMGLSRIFGVIGGLVGGILGLFGTVIVGGLNMILAGLAALASPIGLVIAAVAAVAAAITFVAWKLGDGDIIKGFKKMGEWLWKTLKALPGMVIDWIKGIPDRVMKFLKDPIGDLKRQKDNLVNTVVNAYKGFVEFFHEPIEAVQGLAEGLRDWFAKTFPDLYAGLENVWNTVRDTFTGLVEGIPERLGDVVSVITDKTMEFVNYLASIPAKTLSWIKDQVRGIPFIGESLVGENKDVNSVGGAVLDATGDIAKAWWSGAKDIFENQFRKQDETNESAKALMCPDTKLVSASDITEKDIRSMVDGLKQFVADLSGKNVTAVQANQSNVVNNQSNLNQQYIPRIRDVTPRKIVQGY